MTHSAAAGSPSDEWRKSSYSANNAGDCVEISLAAGLSGNVPVRDSKNPASVTRFPCAAWDEFIQAVKAGHF
ncbi:DUF397 domain-containing protein [Streptomyces rimosus]|uniref:DUF397 domain-containing protein n=1 Tax=Streptomyces rimosus TaxID=1927 RepID=UPI00099C0A3F|nr:DUF397 domain-containing protein [Streptomyces rimosus]